MDARLSEPLSKVDSLVYLVSFIERDGVGQPDLRDVTWQQGI